MIDLHLTLVFDTNYNNTEVLVSNDPYQTANKIELSKSFLKNESPYNLIEEKENQLELIKNDHQGYISNEISEMNVIKDFLQYIIYGQVYESREKVQFSIYTPTEGKIYTVEGVDKARGYDAVEEIKEHYGISIEWNWADMKNTYPLLTEI